MIRNEVEDDRHEYYGTFWLCIMAHGSGDDFICGSDGARVSLKSVYALLSPFNFPGMAGKPKVVVIETCKGGKWLENS